MCQSCAIQGTQCWDLHAEEIAQLNNTRTCKKYEVVCRDGQPRLEESKDGHEVCIAAIMRYGEKCCKYCRLRLSA